MPVRESPDEMTLGAEETGTWKSCINVDHIAKGRWSPSLVDLISTLSAKFFCGIEGEDWEELYDDYQKMSRTVCVRKPQETQKTNALWKMKAAKVQIYHRRRRDPTNHFWSHIAERSGTAGNDDEVCNVEKGFKQWTLL